MGAVLIRCDASRTLGFGHLTRCAAIAEALQERGQDVLWLIRDDADAMAWLQARQYRVQSLAADADGDLALLRLVNDLDVSLCFCDVRDDLQQATLNEIQKRGCRVVVYDDCSQRRLAADWAIYPPAPRFAALDWSQAHGHASCGWPYVLLRSPFAAAPSAMPGGRRILLSLGLADPKTWTPVVLQELAGLRQAAHISVLTRDCQAWLADAQAVLEPAGHALDVLAPVDDMHGLIMQHDLCITAYGTTAYEVAACGRAQIILSWTDDHAAGACLFHDEGLALAAPRRTAWQGGWLLGRVEHLLADRDLLQDMGHRARQYCDGSGADRVAQELTQLCRRGAA